MQDDMLAGDILFYTKQSIEDVYGDAIELVTKSKFIHVAIALNHVQKIEALSGGIMINSLVNRSVAAMWRYTGVDPENLHNALNWLTMQKGNAYSWGDVANVMLASLHSPLQLMVANTVFCSGLACEFLQKAGYTFPTVNAPIDPHECTPATLAQWLGVREP